MKYDIKIKRQLVTSVAIRFENIRSGSDNPVIKAVNIEVLTGKVLFKRRKINAVARAAAILTVTVAPSLPAIL
jgi:hypothetical protein